MLPYSFRQGKPIADGAFGGRLITGTAPGAAPPLTRLLAVTEHTAAPICFLLDCAAVDFRLQAKSKADLSLSDDEAI